MSLDLVDQGSQNKNPVAPIPAEAIHLAAAPPALPGAAAPMSGHQVAARRP